MNKRRRKQRIAHLQKQLALAERRYARALRRLRRKVARHAATFYPNQLAMQTAIEGSRREFEAFNRAWLRRVTQAFGRETIRAIDERVSGKKSAWETFLNVIFAWVEFRSGTMSKRITDTLLDLAKDTLAEAFQLGWGYEKAGRELTKALGGTAAENIRIARTEMHTAAGVGSDTAARSTGLDMVKEWGAADDDRTRETHVEADGQRHEMDEPFIVGDSELMHPGDPAGAPEEIINCRCVAFYHPRINGVVFD